MNDISFLRPFREKDLGVLERLLTDPEVLGPFAWTGWNHVGGPGKVRSRWELDRCLGADDGMLAVVRGDVAVGAASWRAVTYNGTSRCWNVGMCVLPEERGRGETVAAGSALREYLFAHTQVHRLETHVEVGNTPAAACCVKNGMKLEGVTRGACWRDGRWRDVEVYSILRDDLPR
ncbi:GNAT family N-acetyltransferase [Streptomyces sp. NPDC006259]|uniref:GNAT family N-acetyltransferase n=1 Tax=Streptomyces sp. NPDC006259 TaxID=3364740 RepID=UPI0036A6D7FC